MLCLGALWLLTSIVSGMYLHMVTASNFISLALRTQPCVLRDWQKAIQLLQLLGKQQERGNTTHSSSSVSFCSALWTIF